MTLFKARLIRVIQIAVRQESRNLAEVCLLKYFGEKERNRSVVFDLIWVDCRFFEQWGDSSLFKCSGEKPIASEELITLSRCGC